MKISAFVAVVLLAIASVAGDTQRSPRPTTYPSIRIYHPEYKIPIARPYSTIKRESPASPPVVITPSRKFTEVKEEKEEEQVREEAKPVIKRQARPSVVKVEQKEEVKRAEIKREEPKRSTSPVTRSIAGAKSARSYSYGYVIKDQDSFNDFEQQEKRDGDVVTGSYRVSLPDGRTQLVNYRSSPETGNVMKVSYEGEARYPDFTPVVKEKRTPIASTNPALRASQGVKINRQAIKTEPKESPKTSKQEVVKTNTKKVEEVNKVYREVKAVYTRPNPSPPPARAVELPAKYSAQYKTGPPAPSKARSVEPFLPAESLPTPERLVANPERLVATTESPSAPDESLLSIISEKLPNPEKFNAPPRARIVEFPNSAVEARPAAPEQFSPIDVDFNDVFELDGPLPIPAAFRNRRRAANPRIVTRRIVNPSRRREAERWW